MNQLQVVLLALIAVLAVVVAPAASAQTATETTPSPTEAPTANDSEAAGPALGTQLTAFLQSSSAATNDSVENGMWKANFERADATQRERLVTERAGVLERRIERLETRNETLQRRHENGDLSRPAYVAQQSRLSARIDALKGAVADTDSAAADVGVDDGRLDQLKRSASELRGPRIADVARGIAGGPDLGVPGKGTPGPDANGPGPPAEVGVSNNGTAANTTADGENAPKDGENTTKGQKEPGPPGNPGEGGQPDATETETGTDSATETSPDSDGMAGRTIEILVADDLV
ncbi:MULTISPECIES: hypothetical protein [Haloarcula]|uniref:hypothetical protein n=1 Tax=Haloarcula TaxID=2237 RepID=UPI0023EAA061|nr:hypothetical protein [Halomicroarcula sp. XH51]